MVWGAPLVVLVLAVTRQARGGLAALLGVAVALVFLAGGLYVMKRYVMKRVTDASPATRDTPATGNASANPVSVVAGALAVYVGQVTLLGVTILSLSRADWLDGTAFGLSVLATALIWQLSQVRAFLRLRKPVYDAPAK